LDTTPSVASLPSECSWKTDFTPGCHWPVGEKADHPVTCVDWCDAHAYCQGAGKRLCGKIGGGPNPFDAFADATMSQWYHACTSSGVHEYPYGDNYDPAACNGQDSLKKDMTPVGSLAECATVGPGFEGVYDLCGNVWEWEDACGGSVGSEDSCNQRGGSFASVSTSMRCRAASAAVRSDRSEGVGFRCCRD
jgi:formylglycine-generating enzyme required for sulfatase activity